VNFTREPIIETVITPREGCKLAIRNSKVSGGEDYFVDAVEVVSFGHSFFFRSLERPQSFLVPVSDYEVLELKETRMVLKNISTDKAIKIGGGKLKEEEASLTESRPAPERESRKRKGRRGRRRERKEVEPVGMTASEVTNEPSAADQGVEEAPSFISKLFPPPSTLIKESLSKYKPVEEVDSLAKGAQEKKGMEDAMLDHPGAGFPEEDEEQ